MSLKIVCSPTQFLQRMLGSLPQAEKKCGAQDLFDDLADFTGRALARRAVAS